MRLKLPDGGHMTIDDASLEAQRIEQGSEWQVVDRRIVLGDRTGYDLRVARDKLEDGTMTHQELLQFVKHLYKLIKP